MWDLEIVTLLIFLLLFDTINNERLDWADASCVSEIGVPFAGVTTVQLPPSLALVRGESLLLLLPFRRRRRRPAEESRREVDRHGEDDGGVVLGRDAVQRLEIAQLQQGWRRSHVVNYVGSKDVLLVD